jgi:hypothetical protein
MRRAILCFAFASAACAFDSGGQGSGDGASVGDSSSTQSTTSSSSGETSSTITTTTGTTTTGTTMSSTTTAVDSSSESSATSSSTDTSGTSSSSESSDTAPAIEICNGVDDDDDGAIDEYSAENLACAGCAYQVVASGPVQSHCTDPVTWDVARMRCIALGARLATIHSQTDNDEIWASTMGTSHWLGLNDIANEGQWVWEDGSPLDFTRWQGGQPNDFDGEDCGVMRAEADDWNDNDCADLRPFVCRGA